MSSTLSRRQFFRCGLAVTSAACLLESGRAVEAKTMRQTYTYKKAGDLEIKADVYRPADEVVRPVVVWIHGGALINGHREGISGRVRQWAREAGYALVSIDYRLAPETQLPEIIGDVEDAFAWIRRDGPRLFHGDPNRLAVTGGSAGGYLTLVSGFRVAPKPSVLISFWGYGDLVGDWYSKPSPHPRHHTTKLDRQQALAQVSGPPISDSRERQGNGGAFYQHCRQHGTWPEAVSGWNPHTEPEKFDPFMPVKNVNGDYPPSVLVHGTADTDVPYEQSVMMQQRFEKHSVRHELLTVPDGEHGLAGGDPGLIDESYKKAFSFADEYLRPPGKP